MKKVAVIEGGYSSEKSVSIKSAKTVFDNLDRTKFDPNRVLIDENEWTAYDDDGRYSIDKNDFSFIYRNDTVRKRTSIGDSSRSRPKNKHKRRQHKRSIGQG